MRGRKNVYTINEPRDLPTAASAPGVQEAHDDDFINPIGVYGWRKRCLYCLVLLLIVVVLVNIALTAWILAVLNFNIVSLKTWLIDKFVEIHGSPLLVYQYN